MAKISPRFRWMVETLPLTPADRVLEVGGGYGIALALIGERLTTGTVTGVDRHHSAKMIAAAAKRNAALIEAGRCDCGPRRCTSWMTSRDRST